MSQGALTAPDLDRMTAEEWFALPEDDPRELVNGRLEDTEVPDYLHEILVILLGRSLADWVLPRGGFVAASDASFAVAKDRGRKPDLTVYFPGRRPPARGLIRTPPDIAVEIVSASPKDGRRDRVEKLADYAAFRVPYYWIVDPRLRSLEVFELDAHGRYVHVLGATTGTLTAVPGCDGLVLELDALWAELDRLED